MKLLKHISLLLCFVCFGLSANAMQRQTINSNWQFAKAQEAYQNVNLPHTWNREDAFGDEPYFRGEGVYKKELVLNESHQDRRLYLQFDGVNAFAKLFVNDAFVGEHRGGYTAFSFDITPYVKNGANDIRLVVNNELDENVPPLDGDFTMFGGIYRDVELLVTDDFHIDLENMASSGVFITQRNVSEREATVAFTTKLINKSNASRNGVFSANIMDANHQVVAFYSKKVKLKSEETLAIQEVFSVIDAPHLWSPENPYLYRVALKLLDSDGNTIDSRNEPLGIRWFSVDAQKGFFLNGEALKLVGVNRHQDFQSYGNALPDAAHLKDMRLIKEMGCNFLRIAHYPQDRTIVEECDRLGILCCIEVPLNNRNNVFSEQYWENTMLRQQEMVRQSFNHPSVVIWGMLNECLLRTKLRPPYDVNEPYLKKTGEFAAAINALLKEEDPDRLTMIVNSEKPAIHLAAGTGLTPDIVAWNLYHCWYGAEEFDSELDDFITDMHQKFPNKGLMITEYGAGADPRISCANPHRWDFSREYQVKVHKHFMETILGREDVMGGTVWNFADFASGVRQDTDPNINSKGLMTNNRTAKDAYFYYQVLLSKTPIVRIASRHYTSRGGIEDEAESCVCTQTIEVFAKGGEVTLSLNGEVLGSKLTDQHNAVQFDVPFVSGENILEARCGDELDYARILFEVVSRNPKAFEQMVNISLGDHRLYVSRSETGEVYIPEQEYVSNGWGYVGGEAIIKGGLPSVGSALNIYNTEDDPVFQSHREGIDFLRFDVGKGVYELELLWMEPNSGAKKKPLVYELGNESDEADLAGVRLFDVWINGEKVLHHFSIADEVGARSALRKKFRIDVDDKRGIVIKFVAVEGKTIVSGVRVRKV